MIKLTIHSAHVAQLEFINKNIGVLEINVSTCKYVPNSSSLISRVPFALLTEESHSPTVSSDDRNGSPGGIGHDVSGK